MWHEKAPAAAAERSRARWVAGCLPAPAHPARFGLVFSWTFYGVLAAFPRARPCGSGWIPSRLPRCQLASQRLAPLGVRADRVYIYVAFQLCVGLGFSVQRSALWVSASGSLWYSVVLLWLGLYLLCYI